MMERLKNWVRSRFSDKDSTLMPDLQARRTRTAPPPVHPARKVPRPTPEYVDTDEHLAGEMDDKGPGKNALIRNKFVREDTGTHETLKILDDSLVDSGEETGLDPYNTGGFDRSKNWDRRFGK